MGKVLEKELKIQSTALNDQLKTVSVLNKKLNVTMAAMNESLMSIATISNAIGLISRDLHDALDHVDIFPCDPNFEHFSSSRLTGKAEFYGTKHVQIRVFDTDGSYTEESGVMFKLNNMIFVASRLVLGEGCFVYCKGLETPNELTGREADVLAVSNLFGERDMLHLLDSSSGDRILDVGIVQDDLGVNKFIYRDYREEGDI